MIGKFSPSLTLIGPGFHLGVAIKSTNQPFLVQNKAQESINARLQLVIKSGKYALGYKSTLKTLRGGNGKFATS